ncbi:hypothetical protein EJ08DRAFT_215039 [Tothia fuscella]|uniref:Uncharacterized protein n=1 Tax=Tothia fuscella TaxID=1048955 RepID=A0A9P4TYH9_9PEZI|nr:hypothetical protein EJ08DRAFT_215039 [Tothia fuscella]
MAQQGGTWDPKKIKRQQIELAKKEENNNQESSQEQNLVDKPSASHGQDEKTDGQEWDIVKDSKDEPEPKPEPQTGGFSSKFNFQVGWGKWATDILKWDVNVGKAKEKSKEAAPSSSSVTRNGKKDTQPAERDS